ncbi:UNVERIFIED_ORG: hypothetical protein M2402_003933 [Rahnella aquatilis]
MTTYTKIYGEYAVNAEGKDTVILYDGKTNEQLEPDAQINLPVSDIQNMFDQAYNRKDKSDIFDN